MSVRDYFPLLKGLCLEYLYESNEFSAPAHVVVTILRVSGKGKSVSAVARMTTKLKGQETSTEFKVAKTPKSVCSYDGIIIGGRTEFALPVKVGVKWREEPENSEIKSLAEKVKVPAGVFCNCMKVVSKMELEDGGSAERYYAPGVGYVMEKYCTSDIQATVQLLSVSQATQKALSSKTIRRSLSARAKLGGCPPGERQQ